VLSCDHPAIVSTHDCCSRRLFRTPQLRHSPRAADKRSSRAWHRLEAMRQEASPRAHRWSRRVPGRPSTWQRFRSRERRCLSTSARWVRRFLVVPRATFADSTRRYGSSRSGTPRPASPSETASSGTTQRYQRQLHREGRRRDGSVVVRGALRLEAILRVTGLGLSELWTKPRDDICGRCAQSNPVHGFRLALLPSRASYPLQGPHSVRCRCSRARDLHAARALSRQPRTQEQLRCELLRRFDVDQPALDPFKGPLQTVDIVAEPLGRCIW